MRKYAYWNAILCIPVSMILIFAGASVFIRSSDKSDANGYFIAGLMVALFGTVWLFILLKRRKIS